MLKAEEEDDFEFVEQTNDDDASYAWQVASSIGDNLLYGAKWGAIYTFGTFVGSLTAIAVAPSVAPVVIRFVAPAAAESSLSVIATAATVATIGCGAAKHVSTKFAETAWDLSSVAISTVSRNTMLYLYSKAPVAIAGPEGNSSNNKPLLKAS